MAALAQVGDQFATIKFPSKFRPLFAPKRYKVFYGGRGGAKSWNIARALLLRAGEVYIRVLCAREFQNSISESVHHLLCDQIRKMGLAHCFKITDNTITALATGAEFLFAGIRTNVDKIKSMENIDICWVEEAHKVSKNSWRILIPTIRKEGSEIWISFNPDEEQDSTYQMFVVNPPPDDSVVVEVNWRDNPWFPEVLRKEKDYLYSVDPEAAQHIWEGKCNTRSDSQIFGGKYRVAAFEANREWAGPFFGQDFGFSTDPAVTTKCWMGEDRIWVEHEAYGYGVANDDLPKLVRTIPGANSHVIRADCSRPETINHLVQHGLHVEPAEKWQGSVEDGIAWLRSFVEIVIHPRCRHMVDEARLYRYKVDKVTADVLPVIVDKHNHGWDSIRYAFAPAIRSRQEEVIVIQDEVQMTSELDDFDFRVANGAW